MKIPMMINDVITVFDAEPSTSLLQILRGSGLLSPKLGCGSGRCGSCTVLLGEKAVASCILPLASARDAIIITLEYFSKRPEYSLILDSFTKAGIQLCGYCNAGKILGTYSLIKNNQRPSQQMIYDMVRHFDCQCTEQDSLIQGIHYAISAFQNHSSNREKKSGIKQVEPNGRKRKN